MVSWWFQGGEKLIIRFNLFHVNVPFIYHLKKSENLWFSDIFRGYRNSTFAWIGLIRLISEAKFANNPLISHLPMRKNLFEV